MRVQYYWWNLVIIVTRSTLDACARILVMHFLINQGIIHFLGLHLGTTYGLIFRIKIGHVFGLIYIYIYIYVLCWIEIVALECVLCTSRSKKEKVSDLKLSFDPKLLFVTIILHQIRQFSTGNALVNSNFDWNFRLGLLAYYSLPLKISKYLNIQKLEINSMENLANQIHQKCEFRCKSTVFHGKNCQSNTP